MQKRYRISVLILLLLSISLGYAFLTTNLNIVGTTIVKDNKWDIYFDNVQVSSGSVSASTPVIDTAKTTVSYSVNLNLPGDYFEFTVDAKNDGTIDGMISSITSNLNGSPITTLPNYLEYNVSYFDGLPIERNQLLEAGEKETYKVRVGYKSDITKDDLPSTEQTLNLSFSVVYVQSDDGSVPVRITQFKTGQEVNNIIYNVANRDDSVVKHFERSNTISDQYKTDSNVVSDEHSKYPIYVWLDSSAETIYWYSEDQKVYLNENCYRLFEYFRQLISVSFEGIDSSLVTNMESFFERCNSLTDPDLEHLDTSNVVNMARMFYECSSLTSIDLTSLNTSKVERMDYMFRDCTKITSINMKDMDLKKLKDAKYMFRSCDRLSSIDMSGVLTRDLEEINYMFNYDYSLTSISLSGLGGDNLSNMTGIFSGCTNLTDVDMSYFNFGNTSGFDFFFHDPKKLKNVNLSHAIIKNNNKYYGSLFSDCKKLETVDLSYIDFSNTNSFKYFFQNCTNLKTIYVSSDFAFNSTIDQNLSYYMFDGCTSLVGGNGTTFDSTHTDFSYARIDTSTTPGYFTLKQ